MKCPECLFANPPDCLRCEACGYGFFHRELHHPADSGRLAGYLRFQTLISPSIIRWLYLCGVFFLTAAGAFAVLSPDTFADSGVAATSVQVGAALSWIVGNLLWRFVCEAAILLFNIHGLLARLEQRADAPVKDPVHEWA